MQWQEVRALFPNEFVLLSVLDYREVALIRAIPDKDANRY